MLDFDKDIKGWRAVFLTCHDDLVNLYHLNVHNMYIRRSDSGNFHIVAILNEQLSDAEIVALQFALGSDAMREKLNLVRVLTLRDPTIKKFWRKRWNVLYSKKIK